MYAEVADTGDRAITIFTAFFLYSVVAQSSSQNLGIAHLLFIVCVCGDRELTHFFRAGAPFPVLPVWRDWDACVVVGQ